MTAQDIEILIASHFDARVNLIVPNVSWGMNLGHEADLIILRPSFWAAEVEIKVTGSDIKADTKKHWRGSARYRWLPHWCPLVKLLYFALPEKLAAHPDIPTHAGILSITTATLENHWKTVTLVRPPKVNPDARKWTDKERTKLAELGCMRIWSLKKALSRKLEIKP